MKSRLVYRWGFAVLGLSAAVNLIVAVRVFFAMQNPVAYNIRVIEPPVLTNIVASLPTFGPMSGLSTNEAPHTLDFLPEINTNHFEVASEAFHYMRVNGRPLFRLNGCNYAVGDVTAYGTVDRIFPERVYLTDGGYIANSRRLFDLELQNSPLASVKPSGDLAHDAL